MNRMSMLAIVASTAVALSAGIAVADEAKVTVIKAGPALNDVKVVKDKQTGKLRAATEEEAAEMAAQPAARLAPNVVVISRPTTTMVTRPDGSSTIRRSIEDLDSLVAERRTDGKLSVRHNANHTPATPNLPKE
jgi:hypothetical protein